MALIMNYLFAKFRLKLKKVEKTTRPFRLSVQFSHSVMSDSLRPHESQHARPPCPSPSPGVHSNSCASSRWCYPAISSSVIPFSSCPQPLPASESFPMSQVFPWGDQSTGVSALASFLPKNTQGWSPWLKSNQLWLYSGNDRFKGLDLIDRVPEQLWIEVHNIVQKAVIKPSPRKRNKKGKMVVWRGITNSWEKKVKVRGEKERYIHLNA